MTLFAAYPTYNPYRTLKLAEPHLVGEDVYAIQRALIELGFDLPQFGADGDLGKETATAIKQAQTRFFLVVDGLAGGNTQRALTMALADGATAEYKLPVGAMRGQLEHEAGFRLGNYSSLRVDKDAVQDWQPKALFGKSFDAGVAQRNSGLIPLKEGFDPKLSIRALGARVRQHYDLFAGVTPIFRRWQLAQGSWNAPAFACYIAKEEGATQKMLTREPSPAQRLVFEQYMDSVSSYIVL